MRHLYYKQKENEIKISKLYKNINTKNKTISENNDKFNYTYHLLLTKHMEIKNHYVKTIKNQENEIYNNELQIKLLSFILSLLVIIIIIHEFRVTPERFYL